MMDDYQTAYCPWCGAENTFTVEQKDITYRKKCAACKRDFYVYRTLYGVVVSPTDEHAWLK